MAATVMHNMGTVEEHIALCCAADWACEFSKDVGPLRYLDTHAMAPLNQPIGNGFSLVVKLSDRLRSGIPNEAHDGTRSYFDSVRRSTRLLRDRGVEAWYPTHFLHAWDAARARGVAFDALLFENDSEGVGRRACLSQFLTVANFLLCADAGEFTATLAAQPGDFRDEASWPAKSSKPGRALVIMNDPLGIQDKRSSDAHMDMGDFVLLRKRLDERYLHRPALTVNVVFCFSNPGVSNRYQTLTNELMATWAESFGAGGECDGAGIKWGSFMVFVAAGNVGSTWNNPTFSQAFANLGQRIRAGLKLAHRSDVTIYSAQVPPDGSL